MDQKNQRQNDDLASQVLKNLKNPPVDVIDPQGSKSKTKKIVTITVVLLIVVAGGLFAWKMLDDKQPAEQQPAITEPQETVGDEEQQPGETLTQEYTSDKLMIDIKHPANWRVDESSGAITVYSPEIELTDVNGEKIQAEFRVLVRQGATETDSEYLGRGLAIKKSEPINYNDPASNQRKESLITAFGLDASNAFSFFVVQGNFNLKKDETLGKDFASESDEVLVAGGFYSSKSQDETKLVSLDPEAYKNNEIYQTGVEIVKTLRLR